MPTLTPEIAQQLALILQSGMPLIEAVRYFAPDQEQAEVRLLSERWGKSQLLARAIATVQGKAWQDMNLEERMALAIAKHYCEMAYYLYSRNYSELEGSAKQKADTCREAIERKVAGTAGSTDPLTRFLSDVQAGRVKLGAPMAPLPSPQAKAH